MINDTCSIEGCDKKKLGAGFCAMHYRRYRLYGDALYVTRKYGTGKKHHELWSVYKDMVRRCNNANDKAFSNYGGRGIRVCDRWLGTNGFGNFISDMGKRPDGKTESGKPLYTLDRINVDGNYCPENCRWATWAEQGNNQRKNIYVLLWGEKYTISSACDILGIPRGSTFSLMGKSNKHLKRSAEEAIEQSLINFYKEKISK